MKYLTQLTLGALTLSLVACGGDDNDTKDKQAYLRVLHASPDAPAVDIAVNGAVALENVTFQQGSGYLEVAEGANKVELLIAGTDTVAFSVDTNLMANGYYSAIAISELADLDVKLIDDTATYTDGDADVTVVHAAPAATAVDIFVTEPEAELSTPTLDAVAFEANAILEGVAAGNYQVRIAGDGSDEIVYDSGSLAVSSDIALVAVNSTKGRSPVSLIAWSATGATSVLDFSSEVRVVHAVDDINVDVFANGEIFIDSFAYKSVDGYTVLDPGTVSLAIAAEDAGVGSALANLSGDVILERGESYTIIASGSSGAVTDAELIILTDVRAATDTTRGYVRLVHGSPAAEADPVDIYVYQNEETQPVQPTFGDVIQGQDTGYVALVPDTYTVDIAADGTTTPAISGTDALSFAAGDVKTAIAIGESSELEVLLINDKRSGGLE